MIDAAGARGAPPSGPKKKKSEQPARQTLSDTIVVHVRDALLARKLAPGDYIGTEASIAQDFGVSRMAARDAIRGLVAQGVVEVRKGAAGGVRVAKGDSGLFANALAIQLRLLHVDLADLIEAQIAMEAATAELAASHADVADVERLRALLDAAGADIADPIGFTRRIVEFHVALAETSRNIVLTTLLRGVLHVLIDTYGRNTTQERARGVLHTYQSVIDAVEIHDGEAARVLMRGHLRKARLNLLAAGADAPSA